MRRIDLKEEPFVNAINNLIELCGGDPSSFVGDLTSQLIQNTLKMVIDNHDVAQIKLINRALKEMRYAYRVFNQYKDTKHVSVFGSARTPTDHPDYIAAKKFGNLMAKKGWMSITGAADGIMLAATQGSERELSFGLSIRLPFEVHPNPVLEGDPKLIIFRYFFTRKLMFLSNANALAAFPGGFGTMDELFEVLTLLQTGKANIVPLVLMEGKDIDFWKPWERYVKRYLLKLGWISPEDKFLYHIAKTPEEGVAHILHFYQRYHSSRYLKDYLIIRLHDRLTQKQLNTLNSRFKLLVKQGKMEQREAFDEENEFQELPRLVFKHTKQNYGLLRALIDAINDF